MMRHEPPKQRGQRGLISRYLRLDVVVRVVFLDSVTQIFGRLITFRLSISTAFVEGVLAVAFCVLAVARVHTLSLIFGFEGIEFVHDLADSWPR